MRDEPPRLDNRSATSPQFDSGRRGPRKKKNSEKISELVCTVVQWSTICGLLECLIRAIKYAVTYADPMPYGPPSDNAEAPLQCKVSRRECSLSSSFSQCLEMLSSSYASSPCSSFAMSQLKLSDEAQHAASPLFSRSESIDIFLVITIIVVLVIDFPRT